MKTSKKRGISLIVLVITIIIMIILAAAVILSLSGSNVINKANEAKTKSDFTSVAERKNMLQAELLLGETPADEIIGDYELSYNSTQKRIDIKYVEGERQAIIPEGFTHTEGTINTGLVIADGEGNEFVWVPVDFELTGTPDVNGLYPGFKSVFARKSWTINGTPQNLSDYIEPLREGGYATEEAEYNDMMQSVQANKGFYIGRYEAGKEETDELVVKKGANVWNYIAWGNAQNDIGITGAVYRSQQMYAGSSSVVSTLCYGVQWDAALTFISSDKDVLNSTTWGNYSNNTDRASITPNNPAKTGACENWKGKNIYDMAGNVRERTMEASQGDVRVFRGGSFYFNGCPAADRFQYPYYGSDDDYGFRVALYIQ